MLFIYSVEMYINDARKKPGRKRKSKDESEGEEKDPNEPAYVDGVPNDDFHKELDKNKTYTCDDFLL